MSNLSEPIHEDDRALCQSLKEHLSPLPSVPDLDAEQAVERMEQLVTQKDTPGKKGV